MTGFRHRMEGVRRLALGVWVVLCAAGCEPPGKPNPANRPLMPDQILDFDSLYAANCAGCHGATGKLGPAPPLNDPLFVAIISDEQLERVIRDGRHGMPMPPFASTNGGSLTDEQIQVLAAGIRSHWKADEEFTPPPPPYEWIVSDDAWALSESRDRGAAVFARACAGCHGLNGTGNVVDGVVENALNVPAFLALISDQAIRRLIITGRSDLGMPNFAQRDGRPADFQPLTSTDVDDLVAFVAHWRAAGSSIVQAEQ